MHLILFDCNRMRREREGELCVLGFFPNVVAMVVGVVIVACDDDDAAKSFGALTCRSVSCCCC